MTEAVVDPQPVSVFLQSGQAANDDEFQLRVQACIFKLAQDVINEDPGSVLDHPARRSLAEAVIRSPESVVVNFVWLCASNPSIAASVNAVNGAVHVNAPDSDIEFVCASYWSTVAGWRVNSI